MDGEREQNNAPHENQQLQDAKLARDKIVAGIPIDLLINHYHITNERVIEILHELPSLCYSLGIVTDAPQKRDSRPDNTERPIHFLTEGSGMFGLQYPSDAERWKGIGGNHVPGTARQTQILAEFLRALPEDQLQVFSSIGYDTVSFKKLNPYVMRDFMLVSHAGRRQADELTWHKDLLGHSPAHHSQNSYDTTVSHLKLSKAPEEFITLMRVEDHNYLTNQIEQFGILPNAEDIVCTIPDWMFGQEPNTLEQRFDGLRNSQRTSPAVLDELEVAALGFAMDFEKVTGVTIYDLLSTSGPLAWETRLREAYCAPSGIDPEKTFPEYYKQYPQIKNAA